jgi:hypothetical protein
MSQDALDLLLSGVKDQGQRKQITSAYYAFANGDPETFAVQFAVLLRAHAISLKLLPARLEKALAAETRKLGDVAIAHQNSVQRMASLLDQEAKRDGVGERLEVLAELEKRMKEWLEGYAEVIVNERDKILVALASHESLLRKSSARRIVVALILGYAAGLLSSPGVHYLLGLFVNLPLLIGRS